MRLPHHGRRIVNGSTERHINDLLEVLNELLMVPELICFERDEMFSHTLEVMAKARVVRAAVLDELTELGGTS
jgi:CBS domain-containing protein